ncbi:hypothetical protein Tco_0174721 [Tanacetum coccineum]
MVAYLKKTTGSEGFQEIVDFLNGSHIRFALTKNPTIYVSLIKKFWQTATVRTVDNGEQEITAIVVGKEFTITEASVRRHLQLADVEGISALPTTEIFDQLSLMGYWDDGVERATTTAASLDATQASGGSPRCQEATGGFIAQIRSERVPTQPYDSPLLRVNTLGSDKGSMQLQELMALCTKLSDRVKKLEKTVKSNQARRRAKIIVSDEEEDLEDSSKQGRMIEEIDQDAGFTLVTPTHTKNVHTYTRRRRAVSTDCGRVSTASRLFSTAEESVSTAGASMPVSTAGTV